jgi:small-conductance mechanosensitive channel
MREMIVNELTQATQELLREFVRFLPRLLVMLIVVLVGWVIAYLVKWILRSILRLVKFDKLSEGTGATQLLNKAALPSSTELVSRFAFWIAWLGFVLLGISALGILGMEEYVTRFFIFLPRLVVALFFLFFGLLAASFFSRAALLWAVNTEISSPRLLSSAVRVVITVFTASAVFEELGLADSTMLVAFGMVTGATMLGLAIAFGLGGQDLARRFLESRFAPEKKEGKEKEDELSPL